MGSLILSGLVKRRAELSGEIASLRARIAGITADIAHLDAVIRQFDPEFDFTGLRPKRPRGTDAAGRGEMSRAVLDALRQAGGPVSTEDVAARLIAARGLEGLGEGHARMMAKRVANTLRHKAKQGMVRAVREPGKALRWEAAS